MTDAGAFVARMIEEGAYRVVFSAATPSADAERATARMVGDGYQIERLRNGQAFHENLSAAQMRERAVAWMAGSYRQLNAWSDGFEYALRIAKRGKAFGTRKAVDAGAAGAPKRQAAHDREKATLLPAGEIVAPLIDMGVLTREGQVVKAMAGKYRQINRFLEFVQDIARDWREGRTVHIVDLCCGKSYLTFVLYHYLARVRGFDVHMLGLDRKADVIARCDEAARRYGYDGLRFEAVDIGTYEMDAPVDLVVALHACDVATDIVLYHAIRWGARAILSVPCCQHEVNAGMDVAGKPLALLGRYGIVQERFAALATDAMRAALLEGCGYRAQVMEFVELEHTAKNLLIRAVKDERGRGKAARAAAEAIAQAEALVAQIGVEPMLGRLLREAGMMGETRDAGMARGALPDDKIDVPNSEHMSTGPLPSGEGETE